MRFPSDELDPAPTATRREADGGNDGIPAVEQLVELVPRRVKQLGTVPQRLHDLSGPATNAGFNCPRRIDYSMSGGGELVVDPLRISVKQPSS